MNSPDQIVESSTATGAPPISLSAPSTAATLVVPDNEPSPHALQVCLRLFFEHHFACDFSSFDYPHDFERKCARDALLSSSVIALCSRYVSDADAQALFGKPSAAEVCRCYLQKARTLAKAASDEASVAHIQGNLILAMAELLSNSGSRHWLFAGSAMRMAEIMRLNKEFHQKHTPREREVRRRTYWACLLLDRALAYLLGKHRTIQLENVTIAVPSSCLSFDESPGVTLSNLATYSRPGDLGFDAYLIATVCIWSDLADFAVYSRRRLDRYPPIDPRSIFYSRNSTLNGWIDSLPSSLRWSVHNYDTRCTMGQKKSFVSMHFLLHSASCVAHQCYLPHLTVYTKLVDLIDAAGLSYLHADPVLINTCVYQAMEIGEMLAFLMDPERGNDRSSLRTIWVALSILIAANTFLWLQYSQDETYSGPNVHHRAKTYFRLVHQLVASWIPEWKIAGQWLAALNVMNDLYKAAYLGEINESILSQDAKMNHSHEDDLTNNDFRPQPGDGYPTVIALPNLQASVKFATSDTSATAISVESVWLQLSGGWPIGFTGPECLILPALEAVQPNLLPADESPQPK